jgi:Ca2+-binding RTX toxin-like protein
VRRLILLMAAMGATVLVVSGVAYALSVQCDSTGDQDPELGECAGTNLSDVITGTAQRDIISALGGRDVVSARGGDDTVDGGRGRDDIWGELGGDGLDGGGGPDDIDGGPGTSAAIPPPVFPDPNTFDCTLNDAHTTGTQYLLGGFFADDDGNDDLDGGRDNDFLSGDAGRNNLSGKGGDDCLNLRGDANERASGGDGDDLIFANDGNGDVIVCGAGHDTVAPDAGDRVAGNCEVVPPPGPPPLQAPGSTPVVEATITTEEGTITMRP